MIAKYTIVLVGLCLLSLLCGPIMCSTDETENSKPLNLIDLKASLEAEAAKLAPKFKSINALWKANQQFYYDVEYSEQRERGFKMLAWKASSSSLSDCFTGMGRKKQAMELILSLERLAKVCDRDALLTFIKFKMAMRKCDPYQVDRIQLMTYAYVDEHFKVCSDFYWKEYETLVTSTNLNERDRKPMEQLDLLTRKLAVFDFRNFMDRDRSLESSDPELKRDATKAIHLIVVEIRKLLQGEAQQIDMNANKRDHELKRAAIDRYLVEPCKLLLNIEQLKPVLELALILTAFDGGLFFDHFENYNQFYRMIFAYGFCGKLLDEREQLYPDLLEAWRNITPRELDN